jgi:hypothetical protein
MGIHMGKRLLKYLCNQLAVVLHTLLASGLLV